MFIYELDAYNNDYLEYRKFHLIIRLFIILSPSFILPWKNKIFGPKHFSSLSHLMNFSSAFLNIRTDFLSSFQEAELDGGAHSCKQTGNSKTEEETNINMNTLKTTQE